MPALALAAGALPQGGRFVAGAGHMSGDATSLTVDTAGGRNIIDWTSFSIGAGNRVAIHGNGPTLNRVTGADPSVILGSLTADNSLYLINPHGVVVGSSGVVTTAGRFVASTLDVDNSAFMNGGPLTFSSPSGSAKGTVVNLGTISSTGGDVFMIASGEVDNVGAISTPSGSTELVAGRQVLLQDSTGSQQVFVQKGSAGAVVNRGDIEAAQISLQAADGNVYALAGNHAVLRATGTRTRDGHVWLVADAGRVWIDGTLQAANSDGSGGTVDTTAARLRIAGGPTVKANVWNVTLPAFTLDGVDAQVLQNNLNQGTSLNIQTTGAGGTTGDLDVAAGLHWGGAASLTLAAYHSLTIEAAAKLKNDGAGSLTLRADAQAIDNGGGIVDNGTIDWSGSQGFVSAYYDLNGGYHPGSILANASWLSPTESGLVTQITAYKLINNMSDLGHVSADLASNYALGADIDASGTQTPPFFTPIGSSTTPFTGQFDGRGHTISSLTMSGGPSAALGMFADIGQSAVVRDLNVNGSVTFGEPENGQTYGQAGILAAKNEGTILRVNTSGTVYDSVPRNLSTAGGLVGDNNGTIEYSSSSASVTASAAGGLVGMNESNGLIALSHASGEVQGTGAGAGNGFVPGPGGLVGVNEGGTITQSYATGLVRSACSDVNCAGAAGLVYQNFWGNINQSFATGTVDATACNAVQCGDGAGLVYSNDQGFINQSYATGTVVALGYLNSSIYSRGAALVGGNGGWINQSFATGRIVAPPIQSPTGPQVRSFGIGLGSGVGIGNDVYWNKETTGTSVGVSGDPAFLASNGLTTSQMSNPASFSGWDFSSSGAWVMPRGADHPYLRWQVQPPL